MSKYCCNNPLRKPCDFLKNDFQTSMPAIYPDVSSYLEYSSMDELNEFGTNIHDKIYNFLKDGGITSSCYYFCSMLLLDKLEDKFKNDNLKSEIIYDNIIGGIMYLLFFQFGSPLDDSNELKKLAEKNRKLLDIKNKEYHKEQEFLNKTVDITKIEQTIKVRKAQYLFKNKLLKIDCKCKICGLTVQGLLIGSHIKPWKYSNNSEKQDVNNGFLLCSLHDGLFDKGYISFDDNGKIIISKIININDYPLLNINKNIKIDICENNKKYLKWHRENCFLDNRK